MSEKFMGRKDGMPCITNKVDKEENTLRFWQEIYDEQNNLKEIHHKYPDDKGHQKLSP